MKAIIINDDGTQEEFKEFVAFGFTGDSDMLEAVDADGVSVIAAYKSLKKFAEEAAKNLGVNLDEITECIDQTVTQECLN